MASTPPTEEAFLREVDEELRRDQLQTLWQRYGRIALIVIGLSLAAFAAFLFWRAESTKTAEKQGEELSHALADLDANRTADATAKVDKLIADGSPAYRLSARFLKAGMLATKGDGKGAAALYAQIAADGDAPQAYRDLALIRQTLVDYDTIKPQQVIDRLKPLAVEGNAFFGTAGELTALAMIRTGRGAEAGRLLAAIAQDDQTSEPQRARAARLANSLGADVTPPNADKE